MTRSRESRALILDAAERLFAERGFDATPTAAIADSAGVPKGLLFYYFPSKTDLLRALVGERLELDPIDTTALIARGDPARALLNISHMLRRLQAESAVRRVIVWREQRTHPEVHASLHDYRRQLQNLVEQVLRASTRHPIAAHRLRAAATAWVAILTTPTLHDHHTAMDGGTTHVASDADIDPSDPADLPTLADLISAGLRDDA
ncbi:TetR/AcrR family transcriptional regulator [Microbacterium rhizosphaerae]|uniref:Helix-turn-helix domain-containing protein n=1 Tax=Microbacterium rhizosphaerae TaxID=1678237 RepID=A0ABZ0SLT0_9MICO|nr:helix-turn-helix domain-containing protein [Microbacterium rhizosphaerae]WPR88652.1 helix-turn-helix domain-containing protein [Microbacterium rhizosphaerae]